MYRYETIVTAHLAPYSLEYRGNIAATSYHVAATRATDIVERHLSRTKRRRKLTGIVLMIVRHRWDSGAEYGLTLSYTNGKMRYHEHKV